MTGSKTIIFDFDGTLVESFWPGFKIYNAIAPEYGFRVVSESEVEKCRDMSILELLKFTRIPLYKLPIMIRRLRTEIRNEIPSIKIVEGISSCLKALRDAGNRLGIVSTNNRQNVITCLTNNQIFSHFDFLHTSINIFGKHTTLNWVLRKKGIDRSQVVYVGDEDRDIEAAKKCNIDGIAVGWGFQSRERLLTTEPSFFASTPMDIVSYVSSLTEASR